MSSNLPPGVTESMIPGNRPEDQAWEELHDEVDQFPIENSRQIWEAGKFLFKIFNQLMEDDKVIISERLQELERRVIEIEETLDNIDRRFKTG